MAKSPAKNITSLPSQTIVPTATGLGRLTEDVKGAGVIVAAVTLPLCRNSHSPWVQSTLATLCKYPVSYGRKHLLGKFAQRTPERN